MLQVTPAPQPQAIPAPQTQQSRPAAMGPAVPMEAGSPVPLFMVLAADFNHHMWPLAPPNVRAQAFDEIARKERLLWGKPDA